MDFFTVEVVTRAAFVRYHVWFVIDLASRRVEIADIVHRPGNKLIEDTYNAAALSGKIVQRHHLGGVLD